MLQESIAILKLVPDVIWSGILGSSVALFGVMLSNNGNNKRLKLQLDHDASERSKEKITNLRREVYLKAYEDIEITNVHIGNLPSRDIANLNLMSELQAITGSIAKLKLVAEPKTSVLAGCFGVELGALFLKLLPRLSVIHRAKTDIEISNSLYESSAAEVSRSIRGMNKLNEEGRQDEVAFQSFQSLYEFNSIQAQKYADARAVAYGSLNAGFREYTTVLFPEMKELSKVQLKVMVAIREDLGIACDIADFQRHLERQWAVIEAGYANSIKDLDG